MKSSPLGHGNSGATVLVVDDTDEFRQIIQAHLSGEGYNVLGAQSGADAISILEGHAGPINLLITDTQMPGMTGLQLIDHVTKRHPHTRVLCMSGEPREPALAATIPFLQKPFDRKTILRAVRRILDQAKLSEELKRPSP